VVSAKIHDPECRTNRNAADAADAKRALRWRAMTFGTTALRLSSSRLKQLDRASVWIFNLNLPSAWADFDLVPEPHARCW
jgi:hypothetical protein